VPSVIQQKADAWNFCKSGSLDMFRQAYAANRFGESAKTAGHAFDLLEKAASSQAGTWTDGTQMISRLQLLQREMSNYFYAYVKADHCYPRRYPGEALEKLAPRKAEYRAELNELSAIAEKSRQLFTVLAESSRRNRDLAVRFAYEAAQYRCLCEDFLALFDMMEAEEQLTTTENNASIKGICSLAKRRQSERLQLMYQLEKCKEAYLLPSHMRNHSIIMQYFSDLVSYLETTDPDEVELNFMDNTHFASPIFMKLR